ncbi:fructose-specific PTS transporter subunit EIIC [Paenibacillus sp. WLX1005]|uniref:fructose-specific PTS transporter subunit EIIC n=1 Tax=Paenibacillus sp. WLX1005 TaxID=3243766 RepID=UPI0039843C64
MKLLAITSCPNGIAHTYMAAENLQKTADQMNIPIKIETQGSIGVENAFTQQDIAEADGIIIAADKAVDKSRFVGKRLLTVGVQDGIRRPEELIQMFVDNNVRAYNGDQRELRSSEEIRNERQDRQNPIYRHLMNGVSYMIPFIVIGGLLIAIALTLGGQQTPGGIVIPDGSFWKTVESIGSASFTFMVPILAGFIAVSIADRPGLAPGVVGGFIAANGSFYGSEAGAGFLGGIVAGFLAGYVALAIKKIKVPKALLPIMPIIIIPVISSLIVGLIFVFLIGAPIAAFFEWLTGWLASMQGTSSILLALILGAMIAFDMGGPVNKVAFLFGSAMIGEGNYEIMGPIAAAICVPPIGMGLATFIHKRKFRGTEREAGKAAFTMGLFGITEGAIPFAAQDPLRVIPSIMIGSMSASVIAMFGKVGDRVAHGGPIVALLGAVDHVIMFLLAIIVGVLVTVLMIGLLKKDIGQEPATALAGATYKGTDSTYNDTEGKNPIMNSHSNDSTGDLTLSSHSNHTSDHHANANDHQNHNQQSDAHQGLEQADTNVENKVKQEEVGVKKESIHSLTDIVTPQSIVLQLAGDTRDDIIDELIDVLDSEGILSSKSQFKQAILDREQESSTGIGMNIAIPHGKSDVVKQPRVVFGMKRDGVDWNSADGSDARLIFMIAAPIKGESNAHLKILQMLSRKLMDDSFRERLLSVQSNEEAYKLLSEVH